MSCCAATPRRRGLTVADVRIAHPHDYAREKLPALRRRSEGLAGVAVRRWGPKLFPGVPASALLGLTASSMGAHETGSEPDFATGLFGVEASHLDALCVEAAQLLGRPVSSKIARDHYLDDIEGQCATGLLNYARHRDGLREALPVSLRGDGVAGSAWELRATAAAYSSGPGRVVPVLEHLADELAAVLLDGRWEYAARRVAAWPEDRIAGVSVAGKWRAAFWHLRAEQRLMSGLALELAEGGAAVDWFDAWCDRAPDLVAHLQLRVSGVRP